MTALVIPGPGRPPVVEMDTAILSLGDPVREAFDALPGPPEQRIAALGPILAPQAVELAARVGQVLLSSRWWYTTDPQVIRARGMLHDCAKCRAGQDQAQAMLREHPDRPLAVGQLFYGHR